MLLRKFPHKEGLDGYRVLSEPALMKVEPDNRNLTEEPTHDKVKGVPQFPQLSREMLPLIDLVYPNYTSRGYGYKKKIP